VTIGAPPTDARIIDLGFRRYEGPRTGLFGASRSVARMTFQRSLGIHRSARAKVFPVLALLIAYVPTLVFVGIVVLSNQLGEGDVPGRVLAGQFVPSYAAHYGQVVLAVLLVAAFVAPEVLCPDRSNGMLGVYLSASLTRTSYLLAKAVAVLGVVSIVAIGPPLLLLVGYTTQSFGPDGFVAWITTFARVVGAGLAVSVLYTTVSLAISSLTARKGVASAAFIGLLIGVSALAGFLVVDGGESIFFGLLNLATLPYEAVYRIFGEPSELAFGGEELSTSMVFIGYFAWFAAALGVIIWRYRRLEVAR
jgi:ABC-2 type transport system permease protein